MAVVDMSLVREDGFGAVRRLRGVCPTLKLIVISPYDEISVSQSALEAGADKLTFDVEVLEGDLNGADGAAAVFIDIIGRPLTPMSFAGVGRRTAFRGAMYAGAATAGAAAAYGTAAAYGAPYYARPACGYYPYPPCY